MVRQSRSLTNRSNLCALLVTLDFSIAQQALNRYVGIDLHDTVVVPDLK